MMRAPFGALLAGAAGLFAVALATTEAHAVPFTYQLEINTAGLSGQSGLLAFDLIGGDSAVANNTANIGGFVTDGLLGSSSAFALTDTGFFNEELRDIVFGSYLRFTFELTENHAPPGFDSFSFFLLDSLSFLPLFGTTDPTGADALIAVDIDGTPGGAQSVFGSTQTSVTWTVSRVPDGASTLLLLVGGLAVVGVARRSRRFAN